MKQNLPDGIHYLIEFFECEPEQINSVDFWKETFAKAVKGTSMEVLHSYFHEFKPQGITGFFLLSSSHISVHTWPDKKYAACDIFTCASEEETMLAFERIEKSVIHGHMNSEKVNRGYQFLNLPIFCNGEEMKIEINEVLYEAESDFQKMVVADTVEFGKCLIIDGVLQTAEKDHVIYDKELAKMVKDGDERILVIGGGDGYVTQMALEKNPKLKVDVIDLDVEVVNCAKKFLGQDIFNDERVRLSIGDALHFLKATNKKYDGIICDLTDTPIGTKKEEQNFKEFYGKILSLSSERLEDGAWIAVQSGASCTAEGFIDEAGIINGILSENFKDIFRSDVFIPSYGESCAFLFGVRK